MCLDKDRLPGELINAKSNSLSELCPHPRLQREKSQCHFSLYDIVLFFLDQRKGQQSLTQDLIPNDIPAEILDYLTTQIVCHVREKNSSDEVLFSAFIRCFRLCRCSSRHNRKYAREKLVKDGYQKNKIKLKKYESSYEM